jgi:alkanesulfonate monooxygenase SsuD/methylene tetrahydromethanopterin reductase-like flavin-dependent oxidoreductase (luciferase family)
MRFGLDVAQQRMPWDELLRRVQLAEELGFDGAWGFDHFQPMYGEGPGETFEGMTTLAALAAVTTRIRLGLLVTGVTYRYPSVFAAQARRTAASSWRSAPPGSTRSTTSSASRSHRPASGSRCSKTRSRS